MLTEESRLTLPSSWATGKSGQDGETIVTAAKGPAEITPTKPPSGLVLRTWMPGPVVHLPPARERQRVMFGDRPGEEAKRPAILDPRGPSRSVCKFTAIRELAVHTHLHTDNEMDSTELASHAGARPTGRCTRPVNGAAQAAPACPCWGWPSRGRPRAEGPTLRPGRLSCSSSRLSCSTKEETEAQD